MNLSKSEKRRLRKARRLAGLPLIGELALPRAQGRSAKKNAERAERRRRKILDKEARIAEEQGLYRPIDLVEEPLPSSVAEDRRMKARLEDLREEREGGRS